MGSQKQNRDRQPEHKNGWSSLNLKEQQDTVQMSGEYLEGVSLAELQAQYGYRKFKIAYMICWMNGINGTRGPRFRHELRAKHRKAKTLREATLCPI
jgi:hypothetical protein